MLVYLNEAWPPEFDAETLFLDPGSGTGALVRCFSSAAELSQVHARSNACQKHLPGAQPDAAHGVSAWRLACCQRSAGQLC